MGDTTKSGDNFLPSHSSGSHLHLALFRRLGNTQLSISYDQKLLLFDNGYGLAFSNNPAGTFRTYSSPRKYFLRVDQKESKIATEVWNYEMDQSVFTPLCASVYEDAPFNYLVDYSFVNGLTTAAGVCAASGFECGRRENLLLPIRSDHFLRYSV